MNTLNARQQAISKRLEDKTSYDLQREHASADSAQKRQEAVKRAGAFATEGGFNVGSGLHEGLKAKADISARKDAAARLGQIDYAQLQAKEAQDEAQRQREYQTGERIGSQEFAAGESRLGREMQTDMFTKNFTQREQELAQQMTQFNSRMDFEKSALAQNLSENEKNRAWQASESMKARNWQSGEAGASRAWQSGENTRTMELQRMENQLSRTHSIAMTELQNQLQVGLLNLQETMNVERETRSLKVQSVFNAGQADRARGTTKTPEELSQMTPQDRAAYQAGYAGRDLAEAEKVYDDQIKLRDAMLVNMSPKDFNNNMETYFQAIESIFAGEMPSVYRSSGGSAPGGSNEPKHGDTRTDANGKYEYDANTGRWKQIEYYSPEYTGG